MAQIRAFHGIHYARRPELDLSKLIAPPYDVLDEAAKAQLQRHHPNNIVSIDVPHLPPKAAGPAAVYQQAAMTLQAWLHAKILERDLKPSLYPYSQSFTHGGRTFHRRGLFALVKLSPLGQGEVVPHEKTYKGPIEDRLELMRHTGVQLSPIFGLFADPKNEVNSALYHTLSRPELSATLDGVKNDLWRVHDADLVNRVTDLFKNRPVYIADGHHRYTTALQYQEQMRLAAGGELPVNHPANWCLFALVGMQDPGLLILPTHRLIGGLKHFSVAAFAQALAGAFEVTPVQADKSKPEQLAHLLVSKPPHTFGLYAAGGEACLLNLKDPDILKQYEPNQSAAWRKLDVAILQRYLIDEIIRPHFAGGEEPNRGYVADAGQIATMVDNQNYQMALLLQPTPLHALEELGRHGEVMPQKSTYFFPKLATGMILNPLRDDVA